MTTLPRTRAALALLACTAALGACQSKSWNNDLALNDRSGKSLELDTFQPVEAEPALGITVDQIRTPVSSVQGAERTNWESTEFLVPTSGVEHGPLYYRNVVWRNRDLRDKGTYPTADTALRTYDEDDNWSQIRTAATGPFAAATDILLVIPRAFRAPPGRPVMERPDYYARAPHGATGMLAEPADPEAVEPARRPKGMIPPTVIEPAAPPAAAPEPAPGPAEEVPTEGVAPQPVTEPEPAPVPAAAPSTPVTP